MKPSINCINTLKECEDFLSSPTFDEIGKVWNIGYGTTIYPNGKRVTSNDPNITESQASEYLQYYVDICADKIDKSINVVLNQNQFDALVIFSYNVGIPQFENSTLLKVINNNPNDNIQIYNQFMRWVYSDGVIINGLKNRRNAEYQLYIS
jgi:lysozyme